MHRTLLGLGKFIFVTDFVTKTLPPRLIPSLLGIYSIRSYLLRDL